jgi:hypothetical protein
LIWLRIGTGFYKRGSESSWLLGNWLASQEGLCPMGCLMLKPKYYLHTCSILISFLLLLYPCIHSQFSNTSRSKRVCFS